MEFQHNVTVNSASLNRLAMTLENFDVIDPSLAVLNDSGKEHSIVTDGKYFIIINAEGYDYPRYKSKKISCDLLQNVNLDNIGSLMHRKETFKPEDAIITLEEFNRIIHRH
jgi:hypothetical protein